ncbi:GNAT family N-acetyltransferase [Methanolobus halotolerans]|uniref:GNAT family N-acetyltransferase n=1 Tax=Methanolobus halotolerans TaxID=2052935 RepID=A0A4E0R1N6_9EURY|nr:GNAT family N-acetyltransferase [Methanolobus halotolerans]TGC11099.1 GNAT family N-acetyltransferase [Methanolobus halotolerans]
MNPEISIRDASNGDMGPIQVLMSTYFLDIEGISSECFAVAEKQGKIIGAGAIIKDTFPEIHSIAVHPNYRGTGIGTSLIHHILSRIPTGSLVYARTTCPAFFESAGFVKADPSKKAEIWDDCAGCDRLNTCKQSVMCLELK